MSKTTDSSVRKERGTNLTLEQYNMFVAFLKDCIKPGRKSLRNAGLAGNLNGQVNPKSKVAYARFRSIAKRLSYRESDNELIFKSNSKIVLPMTRFKEVILRAHKSRGNKHLNLTKTIQKLGEKYTIGCRQFGITEENVRVVVRMCQDGSCAQRNKTEMGVLKHFANSEKDSASKAKTSGFNETSSTLSSQHGQRPTAVIKVPVMNSIPLTVVKLPNGGFGFQSSAYVPGFTPIQQLPRIQAKPCASLSQCSTLNPSTSTTSTTVANLPKIIRMNLPISYAQNESPEKRDLNCVPIQITTGGAQPLMAGQQLRLVTTGSYNGNLFNTGQNTELPADLSKSSKKNEKRALSTISSPESSANESNEELMNFVTAPYRLDLNNNEISSSGVNKNGRSNKSGGCLQKNGSTHLTISGSTTDHDDSDCDFCSSSNNKEVIDLTGTCEGKKYTENGKELDDVAETTSHIKTYSNYLGPLPHPKMWYFYEDLSKQKNPYERISMCIKDMRLDVMRSMAGSLQATEKMKKKMHYIQELITAQQSVTHYYADFSSATDMK